jgi:hypothetical protein
MQMHPVPISRQQLDLLLQLLNLQPQTARGAWTHAGHLVDLPLLIAAVCLPVTNQLLELLKRQESYYLLATNIKTG